MRPTRDVGRAARPCSALLRVGFAEPPGSPRALVRSYRTVAPLPVRTKRSVIGGLFSVALSCESPRLGVTQHLALWSPDVPRTGRAPRRVRGPHAVAQPAHHRTPIVAPRSTVADRDPPDGRRTTGERRS